MMEDDKKTADECAAGDYEVGYGKPPKSAQFKPGKSGNPRGRPKGTKNLKTDLAEELAEKIDIREGSRSRTISKQRAILKSLANKGIKGDVRAASLLSSMMFRLLDTGEGAPTIDEELSEDELDILALLQDRVRQGSGHESSSNREQSDDDPESS